MTKEQGLHSAMKHSCIYSFECIHVQSLIVYFHLQVKKKPRVEVANRAFILELSVVVNKNPRKNFSLTGPRIPSLGARKHKISKNVDVL